MFVVFSEGRLYPIHGSPACCGLSHMFVWFCFLCLLLPESVAGQRAHSIPQPSPYRQQQSVKVTWAPISGLWHIRSADTCCQHMDRFSSAEHKKTTVSRDGQKWVEDKGEEGGWMPYPQSGGRSWHSSSGCRPTPVEVDSCSNTSQPCSHRLHPHRSPPHTHHDLTMKRQIMRCMSTFIKLTLYNKCKI